VEEKEL